jgi:hypothetical protein
MFSTLHLKAVDGPEPEPAVSWACEDVRTREQLELLLRAARNAIDRELGNDAKTNPNPQTPADVELIPVDVAALLDQLDGLVTVLKQAVRAAKEAQ